METWFDRFPGRLKWELDQFTEHGLAFERDEGEFRDNRRILLRGTIEHAGGRVELEVLYPDLFPYVRPEVYAPHLDLDRHQNPFEHNLCLLDRSTRAWNPSDTGAWLVRERVPLLLDLLAAGGDELARGEVAQGEPISSYYPPEAGTVVFVPEEAMHVAAEHRAGSGRLCFQPRLPASVRLRAMICELVVQGHRRKTRVVARAGEDLRKRFGGEHVSFRWVRIDRPPLDSRSAQALFAAAEEVRGGFGSPPWQTTTDGQIAVTGFVFSEEVAQGKFDDAWLFAVKVRHPTRGGIREAVYVTRGERLTADDLAARLPARARLDDATVAVVGAGALGAPIALELARAQVRELRLLDFDYVEAGNSVRWPNGISAVAYGKVDFIADRIDLDYPFTKVIPYRHRIGGSSLSRASRRETEFDLLTRFFDGVDLVVDASAEIGVQQIIAALADERQVPQVYASATEGVRGGVVARVIPAATGCWYCLQLALDDGTVDPPPRDESGTVQPRGCASPTFTGANFDLLPIVAQATRVVAVTVTEQDARQGPDVFIGALSEDGLSAPTWRESSLDRHSLCSQCSAAAAA